MPASPCNKELSKWTQRMCHFGKPEEMLARHVQDRRIQGLASAIGLVSEVAQDDQWMQAHDPQRRLDDVLTTLLEMTSLRDAGRGL